MKFPVKGFNRGFNLDTKYIIRIYYYRGVFYRRGFSAFLGPQQREDYDGRLLIFQRSLRPEI